MEKLLRKSDIQFIFNKISKIVENCNGLPEMTFRIRIEQWLHTFFETRYNINLTNYGFHDTEELGPIKLKGAPDAIYGGLIFDHKAVGELSASKNRSIIINDFRNKYLDPIPESMRPFFKGIIFDGKKLVFIEWKETKWTESVENFTDASLHKWFKWLLMFISKNPSGNLLSKTFSLNKSYTKTLISALYEKFKKELEKGNKILASYFEEWCDTFMFLYGGVLSGEKIKEDFAEIAEDIIGDKRAEVPPFLFILFTYYTQVIAFICAEILCVSWQQPSVSKRILSSTNVKKELNDLSRGDFFKRNFKLNNFIEDLHYFSWFIDVFDESMERAIKPLLERISEFNFLSIAGLTARDVLKGLYEGVVPPQIRHDLGEVFTPDWLVELTLNEVGYNGNIEHKLLDPGCGRGVFLAEAISQVIKVNRGKVNDEQLFQKIFNNIVGFDINPIAVLTARTNYLIALSPLLRTLDKVDYPVTIPVFMTDSILTPTKEDVYPSDTTYQISTSSGVLRLPKLFVEGDNLSKTTKLIKSLSKNESISRKFVADYFSCAAAKDIKLFQEFYNNLVKLDKYEYNAIVNRIQSFFAPLQYFHSFDFVVGNPPWIKWEFLAKEYKQRLSVLYLKVYKLFSHGGMRAGMGYAHDDISIVFTYVALDKYLKSWGKFAFLLKQTLYKSLAGKEFRKFYIDKVRGKVPLKVLKVHDLVDINPFKPIQSETSFVVIEKGGKTKYPVSYFKWRMKNGRMPSEISNYYNLQKVLRLTEMVEYDAYPDPLFKDKTAPWIIVAKGAKPSAMEIIKNPYDVRHGIVDDLDQVFQIKIITKTSTGLLSIQNAVSGKTKVKQVMWKIEPDLIYPLLKPKYIKRWRIKRYDYTILPQRKYGEDNEKELEKKYSRTYKYLREFRTQLSKRESRWFKGQPFYTVFGLGEYTFKPYKVVWSAIGYLPDFAIASSVNDDYVGKKVLIPDNTIGYIPLSSKDEAYFLCALLNSSYIKSIIADKSTKSKWGLSVELIKQLPLPLFNPVDTDHQTLCGLAKEAYKLAIGQDDKLLTLETEIDKLSERIIIETQQKFRKSKITSWV